MCCGSPNEEDAPTKTTKENTKNTTKRQSEDSESSLRQERNSAPDQLDDPLVDFLFDPSADTTTVLKFKKDGQSKALISSVRTENDEFCTV